MRNLAMFRELCGDNALQNVILTTTMWDEVPEKTGAIREEELRTKFWKPMMEHDCRMARFTNTKESAWQLIGMFDDVISRPVKMQEEMVGQGKKVNETSAYAVLVGWWDNAISKLRGIVGMDKGHDRALPQKHRRDIGNRLNCLCAQTTSTDAVSTGAQRQDAKKLGRVWVRES